MYAIAVRAGGCTQALCSAPDEAAVIRLEMEVPAETILDVIPATGNPKFARELALKEIEAQRPFGGLFKCIIHKIRRSPEGAQVICSVVPAHAGGSEQKSQAGDGALQECYLGFGCLVQLCEPGVDLAIQVGVKLYVLRLRQGLYDFQVMPAGPAERPADVCEQVRQLPNVSSLTAGADMPSTTLYYFRVRDGGAGQSPFLTEDAAGPGNAPALVGYVCAAADPPTALGEQDLAALLGRGSTREPLDAGLHSRWKQLLLGVKRRSAWLGHLEAGLVVGLVGLCGLGIAQSVESHRQLDQLLSELGPVASVASDAVDGTLERKIQAQVGMLQKLGDRSRITSPELAGSLQALRSLVPPDVRVHDVSWTAGDAEGRTSPAGTAPSGRTNPNRGAHYRMNLSLPSRYRDRIAAMDTIVSRAARLGYHVEESTSTSDGSVSGSTSVAATTLVFRAAPGAERT